MTPITKSRIHLHSPCANIVTAFNITPAPTTESIERAIRAAALRHGSMSSRVFQNEDGSAFFDDTRTEGYKIFAAELEGEFDWMVVAAEEERGEFDVENGELARFFILEGSEMTQLVIVSHHLCGDEQSQLQLAADILDELEGEKAASKIPVVEQDLGEITAEVKLPNMMGMMINMMNKRWTKAGRFFPRSSFSMMFERAWQSRSTDIVSAVLNVDITEKLLNLCEQNGVSLAGAVSAAVAMASGETEDVSVNIDMRPEGFSGMANHAASVTVTVSPEADFWISARNFQGELNAKTSDPSARFFLTKFVGEIDNRLIDASYYCTYGGFPDPIARQVTELLGFDKSKNILLADLGEFAPKTGKYRAEGIKMLPPLAPNGKYSVGITRQNGEISIVMQFIDDGDGDMARDIFDDAVMILMDEALRG